MKKLFKRPSPATVIAFIALCVALGGGAYAATAKKVEYKGLSKDARLKVLGVGTTNAQTGDTPCDPTSSSTFTKCTSVDVDGSTGFPRKYLLIADGTANGGNGVCHLEVDNQRSTARRPTCAATRVRTRSASTSSPRLRGASTASPWPAPRRPAT